MRLFSLRNVKLATKLWVGVVCLLVALAAVVAAVSVRSVQSTRYAELVVGRQFDKLSAAAQWVAEVEQALLWRALDADGSGTARVVAQRMLDGDSEARLRRAQQVIEGLLSDEERPQWQALQQRWSELMRQWRQVAAAQSAADASDGGYTQLTALTQQFLRDAHAFSARQRQALDAIQVEIAAGRRASLVFGASMMAMLMALIVLGAWFLIRHIREPLQRAVGFARTIAQGTLSQPLDSTRQDEFGEMIRELEAMRSQLAGIVASVRESAAHISAASAEIAAGNHDLSNRTERSAAHLQETVARLQALANELQDFVQAARVANDLAERAGAQARSSEEVVQRVVQTMSEIRASSERIADIVGVIDSLAFQTNILALNAAVEAARAGEAGRGFAVVAAEVRGLAQRSAKAAGEIRQLIDSSVSAVASGAQYVDQAGQTIGELIAEVKRVRDTMGDLAGRSERQASSVGEVHATLEAIDQTTQQNAALVEQTAAAATHMSEQARALNDTVGRFTLP